MKRKCILSIAALFIMIGGFTVQFFSHQNKKDQVDKFQTNNMFNGVKFRLETNKNEYCLGEPIFFRVFIINEMNQPIFYYNGIRLFEGCVPRVVNSLGKEVLPTQQNKKIKNDIKRIFLVGGISDDRDGNGFLSGKEEKLDIIPTSILSSLYDLTLSGDYEFQMEIRSIEYNQKFDPPLKTNIVKFHINKRQYCSN